MAEKQTLTVRDNRTGDEHEIEIFDDAVRASDLGKATGLTVYDPGFTNTASTRSRVTYIDGDEGILEYRGYPIDQLAEHSTYLEVAYLLIHGELPTKEQHEQWVHEITFHTFVHENLKSLMQGFRYDAHPMGMLLSSVGALSTCSWVMPGGISSLIWSGRYEPSPAVSQAARRAIAGSAASQARRGAFVMRPLFLVVRLLDV